MVEETKMEWESREKTRVVPTKSNVISMPLPLRLPILYCILSWFNFNLRARIWFGDFDLGLGLAVLAGLGYGRDQNLPCWHAQIRFVNSPMVGFQCYCDYYEQVDLPGTSIFFSQFLWFPHHVFSFTTLYSV